MSSTNAVVIVEDPTYLAREINYAHRQVVGYGKSMLAYAAKAGRDLIAVKGMLQHGEFKPWIKANCAFSYDRAAMYMRVAKNCACATFDPEQSIDAFLGIERKPSTPHPSEAPAFDRTDAEHVMKLHAMVERGGTEGERNVARFKLHNYAKEFGFSISEAVAKAQDILPDWQKSTDQIEREKAREELAASQAEAATLRAQLEAIQGRINQLRTDCMGMTREALEEAYIGLVLEREGLTKINEKAAR
ncbi:DUF3102 domain-containing protein [Xanthobacter sp. V0B-10]|uniref:DUF3102 domain-containing protein n=1 Tax=Xanthobacter albus TaxID=3119929 RepID=UPI00372B3794